MAVCVEKVPGGHGAESSYTALFWDLLRLTGLADGLGTEPLIFIPSYPIIAPIGYSGAKQSGKSRAFVPTRNI